MPLAQSGGMGWAHPTWMKACPQCHIRYPQDAVYCFLDGATLAAIQDPLIGTTLAGRYLVEGVIGEGGMATVYRARHKVFDRKCAVKVMNAAMASDETVRERFRREAKAAQSLGHPNVIEIFEQGETEAGTPYMVMELLDGRTLAELVEREALPLSRAVPLMIQIARGIARAHDLGVVHRDLKPENVFVVIRPDGDELVKILDFGIARSRTDSRPTSAGELFGTPQYLAPERISGGETGPSVDLYALGVIFFEIATGQLPFDAKDPTTFLVKHMKERPPHARDLRSTVPEALDALIDGLLEKEPRARPVDAHRVEHDLVELARSVGARVPREPESDPASSQQPLRMRPTVGVREWEKRLDVFEQMLERDGGGASREPRRTLDDLKKRVGELSELQAASEAQQQKLEDIDARGRDGRQRFGFAVDALGLDASRARDELRAAKSELEAAAAEARGGAEAFLRAHAEVTHWEGRSGFQEPVPQLARAYRDAADVVDAWAVRRKREHAATRAAEDKERSVTDLDYQIAELRAALKKHEGRVDEDRAASHARILEQSARAEEVETVLLQLATRFCAPLRARPELGAFFQLLESEASAPG